MKNIGGGSHCDSSLATRDRSLDTKSFPCRSCRLRTCKSCICHSYENMGGVPPWLCYHPAAHPRGGAMSFSQRLQEIRDGFERPFWVANISELFERLSYYGVQAVLAIYLHEVLKFSNAQAGDLIGYFGLIVWFLPILGGSLADRFGFRRSLPFSSLFLALVYL